MYDLSNSGLALRTMAPKDLGSFASDLNHNFMTILNAAGFKGMPGASIEGPPGIGTRGSNWFFVATRINEFLSTYGLTGGAQVTIPFLNAAMLANQALLATTVGLDATDSFVEGDTIVLTSGQVIQLDLVDDGGGGFIPTWIDSGITFEQAIGITEDRVREIINDMIGAPSDAEAVFRRFTAVAKNATDASPGANTSINSDSVIDIPTSDAGPGVVFPDHFIVAPKEQTIGLNTKLCLLAGSPQKYHALIQQTQEELTNDYAPGVDDYAAGVFLQSSYRNGIVMGHRDAATMKDFMRMYRTSSSLVLTSHYSPDPTDFSELQMSKTSIILRATNSVNIDSEILSFTGNELFTKFFDFAGNDANIAATNASYKLNIWAAAGVYLKHIAYADFLSTTSTGKIINQYTMIETMVPYGYTRPTLYTDFEVVSALAIRTEFDRVIALIDANSIRLDEIELENGEVFKDRGYINSGNVSMTQFQTEGNFVIGSDALIHNLPAGASRGPDFTTERGVSIPEPIIPIPDVKFHLNVYRNIDLAQKLNEVHQHLVVKVQNSGRANEVFFRIGTSTTGLETSTFQWSPWVQTLTEGLSINIGEGLRNTGSESNPEIAHGRQSVLIHATANFNDGKVIKQIAFDGLGHPISFQTKDLDDRYVKISEGYSRAEVDRALADDTQVVTGTFTQNSSSNFHYVYPPSGFEMSDLQGFIPSIRNMHFNGGNTSTNKSYHVFCDYTLESARIKVNLWNTVATTTMPQGQYLSIWKKTIGDEDLDASK